MVKIYFSYAHTGQNDIQHNDGDFVKQLKQQFDGEYVEETTIRPDDGSEEAIEKIQQAVAAATVVVFIFSDKAYTEFHRYVELQYAYDNGTGIILISYRTDKFPEIDSLDFDERVWNASREEIVAEVSKLHNAIKFVNWVRFDRYRLAQFGQLETVPGESDDKQVIFERRIRDLSKAIRDELVTWRAFCSYARDNIALVWPLKTAIEERGEDIWIDKEDISVGKNFLQEIRRGIEYSHNYICMVTNDWLTSEGCYNEYTYAKELHKRIIPVVLEDYDKTTCETILKTRIWGNASPEEVLKNYVITTWNEIKALEDSHIRGNEDSMIVSQIMNRFDEERDYVDQHTNYLVQAKEYELNNGSLLSIRDWYRARSWYNSNIEKRNTIAPNTIHQQYIRASITRFLQLTISIMVVVMVVVVTISGLGIALSRTVASLSRTEAQAQRDIAAEANLRLQVLAQLDGSTTFDIEGLAGAPTLAYGSMWISTSSDTVTRVQLNGLMTDTYPTQIDPTPPIAGAGYIWVSNQSSSSVTRIDPTNDAVITLPTEGSPQLPLVLGDDVWVFAKLRGYMHRMTGDANLSFSIGLNTSTPVAGAAYIWYLDSERTVLSRIANDGTINNLEINEVVQQIIPHETSGKVYLVTATTILEVDARRLQVVQRIPTPSSIGTAHLDTNYLWAILQDGTGLVRLTASTGELTQLEQANLTDIWVTAQRAWGVMNDGVIMIDKDTLEILSKAEIRTASTLLRPESDGTDAWFAYPERDTVYLINETNGSISRELGLCAEFLAPIFDGTRMWFSCQADDQLMSVPAQIYYFGERNSSDPLGSFPPFIIGDVAWFVQRGTGRIHAYDMRQQERLMTFEPEGVVLPLVYDAPYLWTIVEDSGELLRIDTSQVQSGMDAPAESEYVHRSRIGRPTSSINIFGDNIWLQTLFESPDGVVLTIVDKNTMQQVATATNSAMAGAAYYHEGTVWITYFDIQRGYFARVDPATGAIRDSHSFENTTYSSMVPVFHDDKIWFSASIPNVDELLFIVAEFGSDRTSIADLPFYLIGVDPQTAEELVAHSLPVWVDVPRFTGDYAWFDVIQAPTTGNDAIVDYPNVGALIMNYKTGEIIDMPGYCDNQADVFVANNKAWMGCWQGEASLTVYDSATSTAIKTYDAVGEYPNTPLEVNDSIIFTFRHSGTVGIFNVETGDWTYNYQVGGYPAEPFIYDDTLWVYSSATDTLQQVMLWE